MEYKQGINHVDIEEILRLTVHTGYCVINASSLTINLHEIPGRFFRHGWQSWSLTTWLDPAESVTPISAQMTRVKDEDIPYSLCTHPVGAWIGAIEMDDNRILLIGAMDLSGRVETFADKLRAFYEDSHEGGWIIAIGSETEVFDRYKDILRQQYGIRTGEPPRVWCSWYGLYNTINESVIDKLIVDYEGFPFDVIQIDDGWQIGLGEWEANRKFPSGMKTVADKIKSTGRQAGIWLAPFIVPRKSKFALQHPDWILHNSEGEPVYAGVGWSGELLALDSSHPEVLNWISRTIRKIVGWGFTYLKLDFLYAAALPGMYKAAIPREIAYRNAMRFVREIAGDDTYLLACGAPIIPSLGLCDGIRIGPDVAPFWQSRPLSSWMNNPSHPGTRNGIRTSLHRLWLKDLINIDPDVVYFRSVNNHMNSEQISFLHDLCRITRFKATSDLPQWLGEGERKNLQDFFTERCTIEQLQRYKYKINNRIVDFSPLVPLPKKTQFPAWIALLLGMAQMGFVELLPGFLESIKAKFAHRGS